jgi:hypothetical protein
MNALVAPRIVHLHSYSQNEFMGIQFVVCVMNVRTSVENPPAGSLNPLDASVVGKDLEDLELHNVHASLLRPPPVYSILTDGLSFSSAIFETRSSRARPRSSGRCCNSLRGHSFALKPS